MNESPKLDMIEKVAMEMAIMPYFVEKDWYITQILSALSNLHSEGFTLVFTGGTALSKAHSLIQRFSEDLDFRIIPNHLNSTLTTRKILSNYKKQVIAKLRDAGFVIDEDKVRAKNENQFFAIEIDYDTYFERAQFLRPHIQLEFSKRPLQLPFLHLPIASFIEFYTKNNPEVESFPCINPIESAADKLSAITWRIPDRVRKAEYDDPSIVRHIHDLALLGNIAVSNDTFGNMVLKSLKDDDARPKNNPNFLNQTLEQKFHVVLNILKSDNQYKKEYRHFVESMSYAKNDAIPSFDMAIKILEELIKKVIATRSCN